MQKTRDLCETMLQQPSMVAARQQIDRFLQDPQAQEQYQALISKGQALQEKQERAQVLADAEIADFESHRDQVLGNPVSRGFLDAQEGMRELRHTLNKLLSMALESGRVPSDEDLQNATCGHGCNCH